MGLSFHLIFGAERIAQRLPERIKLGASFIIGMAAYFASCDFILDFWDMAIATAPTGAPSSMSVSRSDVVVLAGVGHLSTTLVGCFGTDILDAAKFII